MSEISDKLEGIIRTTIIMETRDCRRLAQAIEAEMETGILWDKTTHLQYLKGFRVEDE